MKYKQRAFLHVRSDAMVTCTAVSEQLTRTCSRICSSVLEGDRDTTEEPGKEKSTPSSSRHYIHTTPRITTVCVSSVYIVT